MKKSMSTMNLRKILKNKKVALFLKEIYMSAI